MWSRTWFMIAASVALASGPTYVVAHAQVLTYTKGQPISAGYETPTCAFKYAPSM